MGSPVLVLTDSQYYFILSAILFADLVYALKDVFAKREKQLISIILASYLINL